MIDLIKDYLAEYGWGAHEMTGQVTGSTYVFTHYNPAFDESLKIPITFRQGDKWLFASTHKLLKFPLGHDILPTFLVLNTQVPRVKWFVRDLAEDVYVNIGFEIFEHNYGKEEFFDCLDVLTYIVDQTIPYLQEEGVVGETNLTRIDTITRDSLELD